MDVLEFVDGAAWEAWLDANHADRPDAWLRIAKRHSGLDRIAIGDALDSALCFGWIDGQRRAYDDDSFLQRYCRRRVGSSWSQVNVAKVDALDAAGRMRPSGIAEVGAAKADGRWEAAYEPQRTATVPPDVIAALDGNPAAKAAFESLGKSERYAAILPLLKARTPAAREKALAREIDRLASASARGGRT